VAESRSRISFKFLNFLDNRCCCGPSLAPEDGCNGTDNDDCATVLKKRNETLQVNFRGASLAADQQNDWMTIRVLQRAHILFANLH